jgi:hypothetical protein
VFYVIGDVKVKADDSSKTYAYHYSRRHSLAGRSSGLACRNLLGVSFTFTECGIPFNVRS